jgi:hypothetical protein
MPVYVVDAGVTPDAELGVGELILSLSGWALSASYRRHNP